MRRWLAVGGGLVALLGLAGLGISARVRAVPPPDPRAERFDPVSTTVSVDGQPVRIHAWPSGFVQIKHCHAVDCLPEGAPYLARFAAILGDRSFVEPSLPIWVYSIEHPEGLILVDTGHDPRYYDATSWTVDPVSAGLVQSFIRIDALPEEALSAWLADARYAEQPVLAAVLTHQHVDHTGGVPAVRAPVWTSRTEVAAADQIGAFPWRWQTGADLRTIEAAGTSTEALGAERPTVALTTDGAVQAMVVGGHTPGSIAVRLATDTGPVWFIGDVAFDEAGLAEEAPLAGIHTAPADVRRLHDALRSEREAGALLLAAHDPLVPETLARFGAPGGL